MKGWNRNLRRTARFRTDVVFSNRETKARYVASKYAEILRGQVLDVGADACHLREYLPEGTSYTGVGRGGTPDIEMNLETARLPFEADHFDCVLCLDVLEHLESIHAMFDELCRVSRRYVVLSLPNAYLDLYRMLKFGDYNPHAHLKFYGIPVEPPPDRHRWFFTLDEAQAFVEHRAKLCAMEVVEWDVQPEPRRY